MTIHARQLTFAIALLVAPVLARADEGGTAPASVPAPVNVVPTVRLAGSAPSDVAPALAALLAKDGLRITEGDATLAELWLRADVPRAAKPPATLGLEYGALAPGALVGVVRFPAPWTDYKGKSAPAGTYTLRYAIQPSDGNHMGVTEHLDFLLLSAVATDTSPDAVATDALVKAACAVSGTKHPSVMALLPVPAGAEAPSVRTNEAGHVLVTAKLGDLPITLVVKGHAEVEGY